MAVKKGWTRREALQGAAAAAAAGCVPSGATDSVGTNAAPEPGKVEVLVFIMLENRSFDHWFGARKLLEDAPEDGLDDTLSNVNASGETVTPFPTEEPCLNDPPHGWSSSHDQWNQGACDGFCTEYAQSSGTDGSGIMGYQTRETVPISWALADAYTTCDRYFCAVMGPTWPNRLYAHGASSQGMTNNSLPGEGELYTLQTIWKTAEANGIDWRYYYGDLPFMAILDGHYNTTNCGLIDQFFTDAKNGKLPPVVQIEPAFSYNDNHPPKHPALGELFLAQVYEALAASPQWEKMLIIVTYDEHGGFYDHVSPPTTDDDYAAEGFDQRGFRVPCVLMGPWVKQGVDSTVYDHASWLRTFCDLHGIEPWNKRIAAASGFKSALDFDRMVQNNPRPPVPLPDFDPDLEAIDEICDGGNDVISADLMAWADRARALGYPVRLARSEVAAPFRRRMRGRRLIG